MKIYFARHGESQANQLHIISNRSLPHGLTNMGREQARKLAERMRGYPIQRIYTSPIQRAVETAEIVGGRLNVAYETAAGLREYDCGIAEGRSDEAAWQLWQAEYDAWVIKHDYSHQIEGGESFQQVRQRFTAFVDRLIELYASTSMQVLCISHGGIYSVMLPQVMKYVTAELIMRHGFDYTSCVTAELRKGKLVGVEWNGMPIQP